MYYLICTVSGAANDRSVCDLQPSVLGPEGVCEWGCVWEAVPTANRVHKGRCLSNTLYNTFNKEYHTRLYNLVQCHPLSLQDLTLQNVPLLLLALYEKATLSRASALPSRQLLPDV